MMSDAPFLIVDSHLDLAFSALQLNRDLTQPAATVRTYDSHSTLHSFGSCTVTLPELHRGHVGIVFGTVMSRVDPNDRWTGTGMFCQAQCYAIGRGHLAYYEALARAGAINFIRTRQDLDHSVTSWSSPTAETPIGLVLAMESADPILNPDAVSQWHDWGLRMVGIAHYGKNTYSHGTSTEGGLLPPARPLLQALGKSGIAVDMTHLTDQAFWEVLDIHGGLVAASHHNCRSLVPGQRQLTDAMIKAIAERNGVIGTSLDAWMLDPHWRRETPACDQQTQATLESVANHMDHIAQLTGSIHHCGIGSDLDGGFGTEQAPSDLNTIADLQKLSTILSRRGYNQADMRAVLSQNWIDFLHRLLS